MNVNNGAPAIGEVRFEERTARDDFVDDLDRFLGRYTDPRPEILEAVQKAEKTGFVVEAIDESSRRVGLMVITRTLFCQFQPRYHLAYIAIAPEARGQGVGKLLLTEARRLTRDQIALHVGASNKSAVAFYEKMGWKVKYLRMMPVDSQ